MKYFYTINGIGLNIVFFASKRSALNYAKVHNIQKLSNGYWGIVKIPYKIAHLIREDFKNIEKAESSEITESADHQ